MSCVFLCHASSDKRFIRKLCNDLRHHGHDVWLDEEAIRVGDSLREAIEKGLEESDFVAIALSRNSIARPWVKRELNAAFVMEEKRGRKVILPLLLDSVKAPLFLVDKKYADFSRDYTSGLGDLLHALEPVAQAGRHETVRCRVAIDIKRLDGSFALVHRDIRIRCTSGVVTHFTDFAASDGAIDVLGVRPGTIESSWMEDKMTAIRTRLAKPLQEGQETSFAITMAYRNAFLGAAEYWGQKQHSPSSDVELVVRFPKGRPPISWTCVERRGSEEMTVDHFVRRITSRGKPALRMHVAAPHRLSTYFIRWNW